MIETLGMQALLLVTDHVLGYQGWSVNYAIPSTILFADIAIVFLILVNRMNWQSYFMYQIRHHSVLLYPHRTLGRGIHHAAGDGDHHGDSVRADSDDDRASGGPESEE